MGQKITDLDIHDGAVWCETEGPSPSHGKSKFMSSPSSYGRMFAFDAEGQYLLSCGLESGVVYKVSLTLKNKEHLRLVFTNDGVTYIHIHYFLYPRILE